MAIEHPVQLSRSCTWQLLFCVVRLTSLSVGHTLELWSMSPVHGESRGNGGCLAIVVLPCLEPLTQIGYRVRGQWPNRPPSAKQSAPPARECMATKPMSARLDHLRSRRLVKTVDSELGPVGMLVNNAGIGKVIAPDQVTEEIWNEYLRVNLNFRLSWSRNASSPECAPPAGAVSSTSPL